MIDMIEIWCEPNQYWLILEDSFTVEPSNFSHPAGCLSKSRTHIRETNSSYLKIGHPKRKRSSSKHPGIQVLFLLISGILTTYNLPLSHSPSNQTHQQSTQSPAKAPISPSRISYQKVWTLWPVEPRLMCQP